MNYRKASINHIEIKSSYGSISTLPLSSVEEALNNTHSILDKFLEFEVDVFGILGMRNLSAFVGEVFSQALSKSSNKLLINNPHQDGYPDLLLMDQNGKKDWDKLSRRMKEKEPFSPFPNGGIEIKASCGTVPTAGDLAKRGLEKPGLGDQRINLLKGFDWKAHHRGTNNLIGLLWDFIGGVPRIAAVFYSSNLETEDWGDIVQPKTGGGKTTSVSIMRKSGVRKMCDGALLFLNEKNYLDFINKYSSSNLI